LLAILAEQQHNANSGSGGAAGGASGGAFGNFGSNGNSTTWVGGNSQSNQGTQGHFSFGFYTTATTLQKNGMAIVVDPYNKLHQKLLRLVAECASLHIHICQLPINCVLYLSVVKYK